MNNVTLPTNDGAPSHRALDGELESLPGFDLLDEVGRGGMGIVFRARDRALDREVAVKILKQQYAPDSTTAARFIEEARITGQLQHPGIPAVYQVGTMSGGRPFLAMKLIKGGTLDTLLKQNASVDPLSVFEAIAQAVGYAHAHGVIHRDLKPANIMVGSFGEVQVMDWGLAKVLTNRERQRPQGDPAATTAPTEIKSQRDVETPFTEHGSVLGTPAYMAPEQAAGELDRIDTRADVFGLGAILCVLLTGKPPFLGRDAESVRLAAVRGKTEEAFARLDGCGADPDVVALCKRCLAFEQADRPASADAVAVAVAALRHAADDRARQAERDKLSAEVRAVEQAKRRQAAVWAAGVVVAVLLLGVAGTGIGLYRSNESRKAAVAAEQATEQKRLEADAARTEAQAKEAEANAVIKYFEDHVFAAGRPKHQDGGRGSAVSLRDAILAGLPALGKRFKDQPLVEARLRMTLGNTFRYLDEAERAAEQLEQAQALFTRHHGPDHPVTLQCMDHLANSYAHLNRHAEALKLHEETLAAYKRVLPPDNLATIGCMHNLANDYMALNRHVEALKLYEEALAASKRVRPPDHPATLVSMGSLANNYAALNRHAEALQMREEVLAAMKRVRPPDHRDTLAAMYGLSTSYAAVNRHAEALKLREEALAGQKRVLPPYHWDTLISMWGVAESLIKLGRGAEAIPLIDECVAKAAGRAVHPVLIPSAMNLRLHHFRMAGDPAGCRATAVMWENLNRTDADSLYRMARFRAVAAAVQAKAGGADAERLAKEDADRAMAWLTKAIAAGYREKANIEKNVDLDSLRNRADFKKLVAELKEPANPTAGPQPP